MFLEQTRQLLVVSTTSFASVTSSCAGGASFASWFFIAFLCSKYSFPFDARFTYTLRFYLSVARRSTTSIGMLRARRQSSASRTLRNTTKPNPFDWRVARSVQRLNSSRSPCVTHTPHAHEATELPLDVVARNVVRRSAEEETTLVQRLATVSRTLQMTAAAAVTRCVATALTIVVATALAVLVATALAIVVATALTVLVVTARVRRVMVMGVTMVVGLMTTM